MSRTKPPEPTRADAPVGATLGSWRGMTTYRCAACGYDTVERAKFESHYAAAHPAPVDAFAEAAPPVTDPTDQED